MRIIGIRLRGGENAIIKNLTPGTWYPFGDYDEPSKDNGWKWQKDVQDETYLNELYRSATDIAFSEKFKLSVCCIVGKNGAGKSTLLDLLFRIISNFSFFLLEKNLEKDKDSDNPQKGRELSEARGFAATLYFETDGNLGIVTYNYGNMSYDYYDIQHKELVTEDFLDTISHGRMHTVLNDFFYTICTNYSIHSFNEDDYDSKAVLSSDEEKYINGDWIRGILHKNDGYLTPIVIVPYRQKGGIIKVANEEKLAIQRLSVLAVLLWSQNKFLLNEYRPVSIEYQFDRNAAYHYTKKLKELLDESLPLNSVNETFFPAVNTIFAEEWDKYLNGKRWFDKLEIDVKKAVLNYLCYKSLKICLTYRTYGEKIRIRAVSKDEENKYGVEEGTLVAETTHDMVEKLIKELADDKESTHITLKLHQCIAFMKRGYYKTDNTSRFDLPDSGYIIDYNRVDIDTFIKENLKTHGNKKKNINDNRYNTYDDVFLIMPPSIFKWEVKLSHKGRRGSLSLKGMSSGEKQMLQSASYLLYHIKNIERIKIDNYRNPYHHINIVMDEAELYYHPEYQRQLIANMMEMIAACHIDGRIIRSLNLIIATHSPFVLSDVPKNRILYLSKGIPVKKEQQTFAANYHELLYNQFFINNTMGEVGRRAIEKIMSYYGGTAIIGKDKKAEFNEQKGYFHFVVSLIADNYLRNTLQSMLEAIEYRIDCLE